MRDYVRKPVRNDARTARNDQWFSNLMLMLTFIFLMCAACHFALTHFNGGKQPAWLSQKNLEAIPTPTQTKKIAPTQQSTQTKTDKPSRYDFYKLLPEMTVTVPSEDDNTANQ